MNKRVSKLLQEKGKAWEMAIVELQRSHDNNSPWTRREFSYVVTGKFSDLPAKTLREIKYVHGSLTLDGAAFTGSLALECPGGHGYMMAKSLKKKGWQDVQNALGLILFVSKATLDLEDLKEALNTFFGRYLIDGSAQDDYVFTLRYSGEIQLPTSVAGNQRSKVEYRVLPLLYETHYEDLGPELKVKDADRQTETISGA